MKPVRAMLDDINIAELYHENTRILSRWGEQPALPPIDGSVISSSILPAVASSIDCGLEEAIVRRASTRVFDREKKLSVSGLARLLFLSGGYTRRGAISDEYQAEFYRAAPSAGACYPIVHYPIVLRVDELDAGVYRYAPRDHRVELIREGRFNEALDSWTVGQSYLSDACVVIVLVGFADRVTPEFGERGYRYMLLEAGHIAQNLCLLSTAAGFGSVCVGGFVDAALNRLIGVDGVSRMALYCVAVGNLSSQT
jgi:SagB-type dehydrogenase family enzyme